MTIFSKNVEALRANCPETAGRVESARVPAGFERVKGTDGIETYCRVLMDGGKKKLEWLGGTSMPRASAAAIVSSLDVGKGTNGLGLSMGTGFEWEAFARRLGRGQMVCVYEMEAEWLRMALEVCDLSAMLAAKKIVVVCGTAEEAAGELARFFVEHVGMEVPTVLHPLPTVIGERRNRYLTAGEGIVRRVVMERYALVERLRERLAHLAAGAHSVNPVFKTDQKITVAFLMTERYRAERPLHGELERLGIPPIYADQHDATSVALRLQVLAEAMEAGKRGSGVRVASDLFRNQLGVVPHEVAVETWVPPLVGAGFWERVPGKESFGPRDRVVVHAAHHLEMLATRGVPREMVEVRRGDTKAGGGSAGAFGNGAAPSGGTHWRFGQRGGGGAGDCPALASGSVQGGNRHGGRRLPDGACGDGGGFVAAGPHAGRSGSKGG